MVAKSANVISTVYIYILLYHIISCELVKKHRKSRVLSIKQRGEIPNTAVTSCGFHLCGVIIASSIPMGVSAIKRADLME